MKTIKIMLLMSKKEAKEAFVQNTTRSEYWDTMVDILDEQFPKGECKERGQAICMLAYIEMMLNGVPFEEGKPVKKS